MPIATSTAPCHFARVPIFILAAGAIGLVLGLGPIRPIAAGAGAGLSVASDIARNEPPPLRTQGVFAAVEIVEVEGEVLRFDTRTGLMHGFEGNASFTGTSTRWRVRVNPVPEATSGFLSVHRRLLGEQPVYVLVDEVTGETWLLRYRARDRGTWSRLSVQVP